MSSLPPIGRVSARRPAPIWLQLPVMLIALVSLLPLLYVLIRMGEAGWQEAWHLLWRPYIGRLLGNTLLLLVLVVSGCALLGVGLAWLIERTQLYRHRTWNVLLCLPFAIPSFVAGFTWISLDQSFEGLGGAVLVMVMSKYPMVYLPVAAALRAMDPALEESARMLGRTRRQVFWQVTLPLLRPTILGASLLVALHMLVEFGALSIVGYQTFTTAIYQEFELEFSNTNAAMLSGVLLVLCLLLLRMEVTLRGKAFFRSGQGSSKPFERLPLGLWQGPLQLALVALLCIGCGTPLLTLAYWIVEGSSARFPLLELAQTLWNSLKLAVAAGGLSLLLALPLALLCVRYQGRLARLAERLPYVLHALPGLVIALSLVFFALRLAPGLYQTTALLLLAYALLFLPMVQAPLRVALEKMPPSLEEAARTLGQTPLKAFLKVTLPIISPVLGAGFVLVCLDTLKELTATLILGPTGLTTLATQVWSNTATMQYAAAAPYAALIVLVSGLPVYLITTYSYRQRGREAQLPE